MDAETAIAQIKAHATAERAEGSAAYHKVARVYLGTANPVLNDLTRAWRRELSLSDRVALADGLWRSDIHEARIAAAKLLTQARIRPDDDVWQLICSWVPDFDAWAIADHACSAGSRRLQADSSRIDLVEHWTGSDHKWTKRAALVMTLPWTKQNHPSPLDLEIRDRILGWAAGYVSDPDWFIQKSIAWWLRELSKHDRPRVEHFLQAHGEGLKPFARKEASKFLTG